MKTIKKVTALLLSMVLLLSFITAHAFAVVDELESEYYYLPQFDRLTQHFKVNNVEVESYAQVYVSEYSMLDCDMGALTWVDNLYFDDAQMDSLFAHAAYVKLYAEFESGLSGELENSEIYPQGANGGSAYLFAPDVADVDDDDYLVFFRTQHNMLIGYRRYDPDEHPDRYAQVEDSNTIYIEYLEMDK